MKILLISCVLLTTLVALSQASNSTAEVEKGANRQARTFEERKYRFDQDKKEISQFLKTKNIIGTFVKLLFGSTEESSATGRQVLSVLVKVMCINC